MKNLLTVLLCLFTVLLVCGVNSHAGLTTSKLYFPHVASDANWETEIGIINTGAMTLEGVLYAYDGTGSEVENKNLTLTSGARAELTVGTDFNNPAQISYISFEYSIEGSCSGYEKFYVAGQRVAIPAVSSTNNDTIYISHIASNVNWWTGFALVNTTKEAKTINFAFSDGSQNSITIEAKSHWAGTLASSFPNVDAANIESATITNASGIIGLELFGSTPSSGSHYLSGILLTDQTTNTLYYPHVASDANWWTGIVSYNPTTATTLTITPYTTTGQALTTSIIEIPAGGKYIGTVAGLNLPQGTAWFKVDATNPITGFELFGQTDGSQLAGYSAVNIKTKQGTFVKTDKEGWTGIAFVNTEEQTATVNLTALDDNGTIIASTSKELVGNGKQVNLAEAFFAPTDISAATYIQFGCNIDIVGFQLNSSADSMMLDGLPGNAAVQTDLDGDGYSLIQGDCHDDDPSMNPGAMIIGTVGNELSGFLEQTITETISITAPGGTLFTYEVESGPEGFTVNDQGVVEYTIPPIATEGTIEAFRINAQDTINGCTWSAAGTIEVLTRETTRTTTVGTDGGTVSDESGQIQLEIPAGTVSQDADITITTGVDADGNEVVGIEANGDTGWVNLSLSEQPIRKVTRQGAESLRTKDVNHLGELWLTYKAWYLNDDERVPNNIKIKLKEGWFDSFKLKTAYELWSNKPLPSSSSNELRDKKGVLFVNGYSAGDGLGGGEGTWGVFPQRLQSELGDDFFVLEFNWRTNVRFQDVASNLKDAVDIIANRTGNDVHIVAHSFGGLLSRTYLQGYANKGGPLLRKQYTVPVASLTTLGTPHSGISDKGHELEEVYLPAGQDSWTFEEAGQMSVHQAGEDTSGAIDNLLNNVRDSQGYPFLDSKPGTLISRLAVSYFLKDIPVQVLIGLSGKLNLIDLEKFRLMNGDGLISYEGQRFAPPKYISPNTYQVSPLFDDKATNDTHVTEKVLGGGEPWDYFDGTGYMWMTYVHASMMRATGFRFAVHCEAFVKEGEDHEGLEYAKNWILTHSCTDVDGDGYSIDGGYCGPIDCNDYNEDIYPRATEIFDGIDNNCDGVVDEGFTSATYYRDADGDSYGDSNVTIQDISLPDGYVENNTDCNDEEATIHPEATEIYDGIDNNCDGVVDEGFTTTTYYCDADGDNYGDPNVTIQDISLPDGYVENNTDCNDEEATIYPEATEIYDGIDNNCDGVVDEGFTTTTYYRDADGDNYGDPNVTIQDISLPDGYVENSTDCNDDDPTIHPSAIDIQDDGIDQDCNGLDAVSTNVASVGVQRVRIGDNLVYYSGSSGSGYAKTAYVQWWMSEPLDDSVSFHVDVNGFGSTITVAPGVVNGEFSINEVMFSYVVFTNQVVASVSSPSSNLVISDTKSSLALFDTSLGASITAD